MDNQKMFRAAGEEAEVAQEEIFGPTRAFGAAFLPFPTSIF